MIFDLDGVLWHGTVAIPGAAEAVNQLAHDGHHVLFATNNSAATVAAQETKLASFGIDASGRILSSAMAAASLVEDGERVFVMGGPGIVEAIAERGAVSVPLTPADAGPPQLDAVIVGLDVDVSYDRLRMAGSAIRNGARFIGTNHDPTYPTEHGLSVGGGALVAAVQTAAEVEPIFAGKPNEPMARLAIRRLGADALMIGDRDDTDGDFARTAGYRFGLVLSGVTTQAEAARLNPAPDYVAADVPELLSMVLG